MFSCNKRTVGLLSCSKPTVLRLHSRSSTVQRTYRFPSGLLPCSEPTAFPPASYRAANLPFLPHALNLPGSNRSKKPPFGGLGIYGVTTDVPLLSSNVSAFCRWIDSYATSWWVFGSRCLLGKGAHPICATNLPSPGRYRLTNLPYTVQ